MGKSSFRGRIGSKGGVHGRGGSHVTTRNIKARNQALYDRQSVAVIINTLALRQFCIARRRI
jgi:hypothetical protein